jgi:predicted transposase YdaD
VNPIVPGDPVTRASRPARRRGANDHGSDFLSAVCQDAALQHDLVELIETVVLYKLPRLSREEIQAMLQVHDIRETRVYQEAKEEGFKEGMEKGMAKGMEKAMEKERRAISKMAARNMSAAEIADMLGLDEQFVRQQLANGNQRKPSTHSRHASEG